MNEVLVIESAIRTISFVSCIKFEKWDGVSRDYIHFQPHKKKKGCWSYIGRQGGRQQLSLERPKKGNCKCFCSPGRAMHEVSLNSQLMSASLSFISLYHDQCWCISHD